MFQAISTIQHFEVFLFCVFPHFLEYGCRYLICLNSATFGTTSAIQHNPVFYFLGKKGIQVSSPSKIFGFFLFSGKWRQYQTCCSTMFRITSTIQHNEKNGMFEKWVPRFFHIFRRTEAASIFFLNGIVLGITSTIQHNERK